MGLLDFLRRKTRITLHDQNTADMTHKKIAEIEEILSGFDDNDYLGEAAAAGHKAKQAIKQKDYNTAWRLLQEQKVLYMRHANRSNFTPEFCLGLDSSVSEDLANVLRLEGMHDDALVHIIYWCAGETCGRLKRHDQKLSAYFKRCEFKSTNLDEVNSFIEELQPLPDFRVIQNQVSAWKDREKC